MKTPLLSPLLERGEDRCASSSRRHTGLPKSPLAVVAVVAWAGGAGAATTVTLPRDPYFQGLYAEIRDRAARGRWERVEEDLRDLAGAIDRARPSAAIWITPQHALGLWAAFQRLLTRLPEDVQAGFLEFAAPAARAALSRARGPDRLGILHRVARDLPMLEEARRAERELLELDLEAGRFATALARCERLLARPELDEGARFAVAARALACAVRLGDLACWRRWRPLVAAFDPGTDTARADLRRRILELPAPDPAPGAGSPPFLPGAVVASFATGRTPAGPPPAPPLRPAADEARIYLPVARGLVCVDRRLRVVRWEADLDWDDEGAGGAAAAVGADGVFVAVRGGIARLDKATGRPAWRATCRRSEEGPGLEWPAEPEAAPAGRISLTPPLLADGRLVVGVILDGDGELPLYLAALDSSDGRPLWTTPLGSSHAENYLGLGVAAAPLAAEAGRVFFATGCGAVAAVDLADGALAWVRAYPARLVSATERAVRTGDRWAICAPVPAGDRLVVAPRDADELLALDARTGAILWRAPREGARYLLGVRDGKAIVAGRWIRGVHLRGPLAGATAWARRVEPAALRPAGRGALTGPWALVPGREGLLALDASTGAVAGQALWDRPAGGGDLLPLEDGLLVTGPTSHDLYGSRQEERAGLERLPGEDAVASLKRAKAALKGAGIAAGRREIDAWRDRRGPGPAGPEEDRLRYEIVHMLTVWLEVGGLSPDDEIALLRLRVELEADRQRRVAHAAALAEALQRRGDIAGALEAWHGVLPLPRGVRYRVDPHLSVAALPYIRERIVRLLEGRPDRAALARPYEERARRELAVAETFATPATFRRVIDAFPATDAARRAYWRIAEIAGGEGAGRENLWTAYIALREYVEAFPDAEDVPAAHRKMAECLEGLGRLGEARRAGGLRLPVALAWRTGTSLRNRVMNRRSWILRPAGAVPPELEDAWLTASVEGRECRNLADGTVRWTFLSKDEGVVRREARDPWIAGPRDHGAFVGSLYLFHDGRTIVALEAATGRPRWSRALKASGGAAGRSVSVPTVAGVRYDPDAIFAVTFDGTLSAIDPRDGSARWKRKLPFAPQPRCGPIRVRDALFLLRPGAPGPQAPAELLLLDPGDGRERARVPLEGLAREADRLIELPGRGVVAVLRPGDLACVDAAGRLRWTRRTGARIRRTWLPAERPDRLLLCRMGEGKRELAAIATDTGEDVWAHPFAAGSAPAKVVVEGDRVFALAGDAYEREVVALAIEPLPGGDRAVARERWRHPVGHYYDESDFLVARDAILLPDGTDRILRAYDKEKGTRKAAEIRAVLRFLRGKRPIGAGIVGGTLIVLADFGEAGFVVQDPFREREREVETLRLAARALGPERDLGALAALGRALFREGAVEDAVGLVEGALLREEVPPSRTRALYQLLAGWTEEEAERRPPIIRCRAVRRPRINGRLDEWWNPDLAVELDGPARVRAVQAPNRLAPDWRGAEDLSATIYTGWDRENLYLAVDVRDDHTQPHKREDAPYWVGDFLLIGLDPEDEGGFGAGGDDKLWTLALVLPQRKKGPAGRDEEEAEGEFHVRAKDDDSGAVYEVALPWRTILARRGEADAAGPHPGMRLGLSLVVGDDDTGRGTTKILSQTPGHILERRREGHVWRGFTPERFPKLVLEGEPPAAEGR